MHGCSQEDFIAAQVQMMTRYELEAEIGGQCELREEYLEKIAGGVSPTLIPAGLAGAALSASVTGVSIPVSAVVGGW
jgi:hypothetical protein